MPSPVGNSDKGPGDRRLWLQRVRRLFGERSLRQHDQTRRARRPSWAQTLRQDPAGSKGINSHPYLDNSVEPEALLYVVPNSLLKTRLKPARSEGVCSKGLKEHRQEKHLW